MGLVSHFILEGNVELGERKLKAKISYLLQRWFTKAPAVLPCEEIKIFQHWKKASCPFSRLLKELQPSSSSRIPTAERELGKGSRVRFKIRKNIRECKNSESSKIFPCNFLLWVLVIPLLSTTCSHQLSVIKVYFQ